MSRADKINMSSYPKEFILWSKDASDPNHRVRLEWDPDSYLVTIIDEDMSGTENEESEVLGVRSVLDFTPTEFKWLVAKGAQLMRNKTDVVAEVTEDAAQD